MPPLDLTPAGFNPSRATALLDGSPRMWNVLNQRLEHYQAGGPLPANGVTWGVVTNFNLATPDAKSQRDLAWIILTGYLRHQYDHRIELQPFLDRLELELASPDLIRRGERLTHAERDRLVGDGFFVFSEFPTPTSNTLLLHAPHKIGQYPLRVMVHLTMALELAIGMGLNLNFAGHIRVLGSIGDQFNRVRNAMVERNWEGPRWFKAAKMDQAPDGRHAVVIPLDVDQFFDRVTNHNGPTLIIHLDDQGVIQISFQVNQSALSPWDLHTLEADTSRMIHQLKILLMTY